MTDESEEQSDMELLQNYMEASVEVFKGGKHERSNTAMQIAFFELLQQRNFSVDLLERGAAIAVAKAANLCDEKTEMDFQMEVLAIVLKNKSESLITSSKKS